MSAEDDIVQWKLEGNTGPIQRELNFMKYNKLAVCGCSVSDRTKVEHAYGDYLSAKLDIDYLHFAGGAGSDKRGFRLPASSSSNTTRGSRQEHTCNISTSGSN